MASTELSKKDLHRMFDAVCRVLSKTGMRVTHATVLDRLESFGVKVDKAHKQVFFSEKAVHKTLECVRKSKLQKGRKEPKLPGRFSVHMGDTCFFFWDHEKQIRRKATRQDFIDTINFANARKEIIGLSTPVELGSADVRVMSVEMMAEAYLHTSLPVWLESNIPQQVKWLNEIHKVVSDYRDLDGGLGNASGITSPLVFGDRAADLMIEGSKYGWAGNIYTMAIAGANAPATNEACAVQAAAEILGGWACMIATDPEKPFGTLTLTGTLDMRTGKACFASPGAVRQNMMVGTMFRDIGGVYVRVSYPWYTDAVVPGLKCAMERQAKILAYAAYSGVPEFHVGDVDGASVFSLEQAVIDLEVCRSVYEMYKPVKMDKEMMAVNEIDRIGPDHGKSHMDSDFTIEKFRDNLWSPEIMANTYWAEGTRQNSEREILDLAHKSWKKTLAGYEPEPPPRGLKETVEKVLTRAREELLSMKDT